MKLCALEVENFRGVRKASVQFGPGLTVLHGPNDLGKSTLAEAVRAALLVPSKSQEGRSYVAWGASLPARVALTFEHGGFIWRVRKKFGSPSEAILEKADPIEGTDPPRFRGVLEGNGVEGKLREVLSWGIAAPAGKGKPAKLTNYLVTALLGRQGEVQDIFEASLAGDTDPAGKDLIAKALGAMGSDPFVRKILDQLAKRVDEIFDAHGNFRKASSSRLVVLQQRLRSQEEQLNALRTDDAKGKVIEERVVTLQAERRELGDQLEAAEAEFATAGRLHEQQQKRSNLQEAVDGLRKQVEIADHLEIELQSLTGDLNAREADRIRLAAERDRALSALTAIQTQIKKASEDVVRLTAEAEQAGRLAEAARGQRLAELNSWKTGAVARLNEIASAEQTLSEATKLKKDVAEARVAANSAALAVTDAERAVELAKSRAQLAALEQYQENADRLQLASDEARRQEEQARTDLSAAEAALAEATSHREGGRLEADSSELVRLTSELTLLRAVQLRIATWRVRRLVSECEGEAARHSELLEQAVAKRSTASTIEKDVVARVLPMKEQVASWRALEKEIAAGAANPVLGRHPLPALAAAIAAWVAAAFALRFAGSMSWVTAGIVATTIGLGAGIAVWTLSGRKARIEAEESDQRRRQLAERWKSEVEPSLRRAALSNLGAYEAAVAGVQEHRQEAERLRAEAQRADGDAAVAAQAAAPLAAHRAELTRLEADESASAVEVPAALVEQFEGDQNGLQQRLEDLAQRLAGLRFELTQKAEEAVVRAGAVVRERRSTFDEAMKRAASDRAEYEQARKHCDPSLVERLRAAIASLGGAAFPELSPGAAQAQLDARKEHAAKASAGVGVLQTQLDDLTPKLDELTAGGRDLSAERAGLQTELAEAERELELITTRSGESAAADGEALAGAQQELEALQEREGAEEELLERAATDLAGVEQAIKELENKIATKRGELNTIDRAHVAAQLQATLADPVFQIPASLNVDVQAASAKLKEAGRKLEECDGRLNSAKGQLTLVAGHVGAERLAQQEEVVKFAQEEVLDRELTERAALRLLNEIRTVEAERASHLGHTLAGPISQTFQALTKGRYGQIKFDQNLKTEDVAAAGEGREITDLSVGTREQLATLIRLAVAANLGTALVLDDQLVHSDSGRLAWFRDQLRASARDFGHQVIVFTCRLEDYCRPDNQGDHSSPVVIDLGTAISQAAVLANHDGSARV
jgi:DNA repair exonuclease SbcCD ATPase subunit